MPKIDFYRFWHIQAHDTITHIVLHQIDFRFQCQIFSCYYAFAIKLCNDSGSSEQTCLDSYGPSRGVALVYLHNLSRMSLSGLKGLSYIMLCQLVSSSFIYSLSLSLSLYIYIYIFICHSLKHAYTQAHTYTRTVLFRLQQHVC